MKEHDYDLLKTVGQPAMYIGGAVYVITKNDVARAICFAGAVLMLAWAGLDIANCKKEQDSKAET